MLNTNLIIKKIKPKFSLISLMVLISFTSASQEVRWAQRVIKFSSELGSPQYSAFQILGEPNAMPGGGSNPVAWSPKSKSGLSHILIGFDTLMPVRQVIISENYNAGCIFKLFLIDQNNKKHEVFSDEKGEAPDGSRVFTIRMNETPYRVKAAQIYVNASRRDGWPQIDAVGISSSNFTYEPPLIVSADSKYFGTIENLGSEINSIYDEVTPTVSPDNSFLYFVRKRHPENKGPENADDIWYAHIEENEVQKAKQLGAPLNTETHNAICAVLPGNDRLLVRDNYGAEAQETDGVAISKKGSLGWQKPVSQSIDNFYNRNQQSSFFIGADERFMLMAIEREDSYGGLDLYVSERTGENSWSEPSNLGRQINSAADEITPFLAADGKTLYFSSKGHGGYGNNDILYARRKDDTWQNWAIVKNIGAPVNNKEWNAFFSIPASGEYGYFVSYDEGMGMADLFRVKLPPDAKPEPVKMITATVINAKTGKPMKAKFISESIANKQIQQWLPEEKKEKLQLAVKREQDLSLLAEDKNFFPVAQRINTDSLNRFSEENLQIMMVPLEVGATIRLNNIFFEFAKAELKESSHKELNRVVRFLNDNPSVKIEISGHTDSKGSKEFNLTLSQNRAQSVVDYLLEKGINRDRLIAKGYGQSKPVASNDTDEGRKANRRVEFTILEK